MGKKVVFSGSWQGGAENIEVNLPLIAFQEDRSEIIYCPALDVSGYGTTEKEASESFLIALGEFFRYTLNKKTFLSELTGMGWKIRKSRPMRPPDMSVLLKNNDNFSRIFNSYNFKKYSETISIPLPCE